MERVREKLQYSLATFSFAKHYSQRQCNVQLHLIIIPHAELKRAKCVATCSACTTYLIVTCY